VAACVPETGVELIPEDSYILEMGFDRLGGVDHRKGCYVGQEVTARMKHKTELRKGLVTVTIAGRLHRARRSRMRRGARSARSTRSRAAWRWRICGMTGQRGRLGPEMRM
jgi:folate-binding protein YgfZ